jgi:hypothetical protein
VVSRWAFRALAERAEQFVNQPEDEYALRQAVALDGLHFELLPAEQSPRIARAVATAADELRLEYRDGPEARDREFSDALGTLRLWLSDLTDE